MKFFSFEHLRVILITAFILAANKSESGLLIGIALYGAFLAVAMLNMLSKQFSEFEKRLDAIDEILKGLK